MSSRKDYIAPENWSRRRFSPNWHLWGLAAGLPLVILGIALSTNDAGAAKSKNVNTIDLTEVALGKTVNKAKQSLAPAPHSIAYKAKIDPAKLRPKPMPKPVAARKAPPPVVAKVPLPHEPLPHSWSDLQIKRGDTLDVVFKRNDLSYDDMRQIIKLKGETEALVKYLRPGGFLRIRKNDKGQLAELVFKLDEERTLHVERGTKGWSQDIIKSPTEKRIAHAAGTVNNSLFHDGKAAGLSDRVIMGLVKVFGWDIDFALDIREGDHFVVTYEEVFRDGEKIRDGDIVAAEFSNRGKAYRAVKYTNPEGQTGYYNPEGKPMRKAFLRTPVEFARISSRFTHRRWHPVLKRWRSHKGVDYAAPSGTPIKAAGDGRVVFRGWKGGYGRTVIVQHAGRYTTLYAHMSRYRSSVRNGSRVKQGQVIGYVGASGLATGPHLHYEFRIGGAHKNPLTARLPAAPPLAKKYKADFTNKTQPLLAKLDTLRDNQLALNSSP